PELAVGVAGRADAVALGEATTPGPLLARRLVLPARDEVAAGLEGLAAGGAGEPGGDQDVLFRESQHGPAQPLLHDRPQHGVTLGRPLDGAHADEHAGRAADALEGREGEALELAVLASLGHQDPRLGFLRDRPDLVRERAL